MNVTVVPFFLAAVLPNNEKSGDWKFGPEYSYNLSIIYDLKQNIIDETLICASINSTVQCRPKDPKTLFCRLNNSSSKANIIGRKIAEDIDSERVFGIKFNERGVEALLEKSPGDIRILNIIRMIANQFSMDANLIRKSIRPTPRFIERESTSMGNCMTSYVVKREEHQPNTITRNTNFDLRVLPVPNLKPGIKLSISKNRNDCVDVPEKIDIFEAGIFKLEKFTSAIQIDDGTYKTFTEIIGHMKPPNPKNPERAFLPFKETIELNLDSITPAQDQLPAFDGEVIELNTKIIPE